ncbi:Rhs family protein [Pseudomonas orientalis]|uniref:hypothetical protein n=1 Tax=Pseudomonas orientalis TaxID=76758 RepID=UPI000F6E0038|nr:hypothetical protein [Pseudomonas orientalis]AZE93753.1 Rhs family protein [Pseudomonas orientalis]
MIPALASFVLAPMDPEAPDVERVLQDLRNCLNTFDAWADSLFSGSALEVRVRNRLILVIKLQVNEQAAAP